MTLSPAEQGGPASVLRDAPLALVTGSYRRLGARIAQGLAARGYVLALHGRHDGVLDPDLERALEAGDAIWHGFTADLSVPEAAGKLMAAVKGYFGRAPDLLVNSAATFGQDRLEDVTAGDLMRHYAVNCAAPVLLTRAFAESACEEEPRDRCVINILDQRLANPHGDQLSYTLSKQALAGFTRIAARELAGRRIRVNAVAPGLTLASDDYDEGRMASLAGRMPLGRLPEPEEINRAIGYLADAGAVTGQVVMVDGGAHLESYARDFMHL